MASGIPRLSGDRITNPLLIKSTTSRSGEVYANPGGLAAEPVVLWMLNLFTLLKNRFSTVFDITGCLMGLNADRAKIPNFS